MPLQEQTLEVEFTAGLDTRQDRKRRSGKLPGQLLELENARFERAADGGEGGTVHRRPGSPLLSDALLEGGTLTGALALQSTGNEVLRWNSGGVYGRAVDSGATWVRRADADDARPLTYSTAQRVARARAAEAHDCVSVGTLDVLVWTEAEDASAAGPARRVLLATVLERATGVQYQDALELAEDTAGTDFWRLQPRLVAVSTGAVVVYATGGKLYARALDSTAPEAWGAAVELAADVASRTGLRFPFELDAVASSSTTVRALYTATSSGTSSVAPVASTGTNPAPLLALSESTTYTGTINFRVTGGTGITLAHTVANVGASNPTVARTAYSFTGTAHARVAQAPSLAVARTAGSGAEALPTVSRTSYLFDGTVDVGLATVPFTQSAKNVTPWCDFRFDVAGQINAYGAGGGIVHVQVLMRYAAYTDPDTGIDYGPTADVRVTGPGGLFEEYYTVAEGSVDPADYVLVAPIGYSFRLPNLTGDGNAANGQYWDFRCYPHVAQVRLNGGAWVTTKPDTSPLFPFDSDGSGGTVALALPIYSGADSQGLALTLDAAHALTCTTADVWQLTVHRGSVAFTLNGGAEGAAVPMFSLTTGAAYAYEAAPGLTFTWPEVYPSPPGPLWTTGDTFTATVPAGAFVYRLGAGADSAPLALWDGNAAPLTHALLDGGGSPLGISLTWPAGVEHPVGEEWQATVTSASRLVMLSLQLPGGVPTVTLGPTNLGSPVLEGLTAQATGTSTVRVVYRNLPANAVEARSYDGLHALTAGPLALATSPASEAASGLLHVGLLDVGLGQVLAVLEPLAQAPLEVVRFTDAGVTEAVAVLVRGLRLLSRPFTLDGRPMVAAVHLPRYGGTSGTEPGVQPTAFILTLDTRRVVGRALTGQAGPLVASGLPKVLAADGAGVAVLIPQRLRLVVDRVDGRTVDLTPTGLVALQLRAEEPARLLALHDGAGLHLGGAAPAYYDGTSWAEDGFHLAPEGVTVSTTGLPAGGLSAGAYSWAVLYEWTDARGRLHRSAPGVPVSAAVAAPGGRAALAVPLLHLTRKRGVRLVVYRTLQAGSLYYRALTVVQSEAGTADTLTIEDGTADADLVDNEVLYSTGANGGALGGELEHLPPPAYSAIHRHQDYLVVNAMDDPYAFAFSLPVAEGEGPAWSDVLTGRVPATTGRVVGFQTLDDKLVIFTEGAPYVIVGQGPDKMGGSNGFSVPQQLAGGVGCEDARAVASTPDGLLFKAPGGVCLLARTLETVGEVGYGVHAWRGLTCTGAVYLPELRESRFYTLEGRTLVYSHAWRQWSTFTAQPARRALLVGGVPYFADGAAVRYEDAESFDAVPVVVGTGWLAWGPSYANVQRVWRYILVGTGEASHTVHAEVFYDFRESTAEDDTTEHFPGPADGGDEVYTLRHHLSQQECNALRFRWTFTPDGGTPGEGDIGITLLALEVGLVQGRMGKRLHTREQ